MDGASRISSRMVGNSLNTGNNGQKDDREKLRRNRLNKQFVELGTALDPDRPKNDKATILTDTIHMLADLKQEIHSYSKNLARTFGESLDSTRTVIWNGTMGVFEFEKFVGGTEVTAKKLADLSGKGVTMIIGGADFVATVEKVGLTDKMSHISTDGREKRALRREGKFKIGNRSEYRVSTKGETFMSILPVSNASIPLSSCPVPMQAFRYFPGRTCNSERNTHRTTCM